MAEFPALPIWTDAYLADTRHLTTIQHGAYLLLLVTAWRTPDCALPDDDQILARYAGCDLRTWRHHKAAVMAFWRLGEDGLWRQKKLTSVRQNVADLSSKRAKAGRKGASARMSENSGDKPLNSNETAEAKPTSCHKQNASKTEATKTKTNISVIDKSIPAPSAPLSHEKLAFDLGRKLFGPRQGGSLTAKLRKHCGGDDEATLATLRTAEGKSDPRQYVGAVLRGELSTSHDFDADYGPNGSWRCDA